MFIAPSSSSPVSAAGHYYSMYHQTWSKLRIINQLDFYSYKNFSWSPTTLGNYPWIQHILQSDNKESFIVNNKKKTYMVF